MNINLGSNMKTIRFIATLFYITAFFISCGEESISSDASSLTAYTVPAASTLRIGNIDSLVKKFDIIELSADVASRIGTVFSFCVIPNGDLVLADHNSAIITRLNRKGEILWQIQPQEDDYRYHDAIENDVRFDEKNERLYVTTHFEVFTYDLNGTPNGPLTTFDMFSSDLVLLPSGDILRQSRGNIADLDGKTTDRQLIWISGTTIKNSFIDKAFYPPTKAAVGGFPLFSKWDDDHLYYHAAFMDTFYRIELPDVYPEFTFSFDEAITTQDLMKDPSVKSPLSEAHKEEIPILYRLGANEEKIVASYKNRGLINLIVLNRKNSTVLINNPILSYQNVLFEAPLLYHGGYFLTSIPAYKVNHFAILDPKAKTVDTNWSTELEKLEESYNETGPISLYLMEF